VLFRVRAAASIETLTARSILPSHILRINQTIFRSSLEETLSAEDFQESKLMRTHGNALAALPVLKWSQSEG
jgi:hypothetical protein